jgi:hypothetical protein
VLSLREIARTQMRDNSCNFCAINFLEFAQAEGRMAFTDTR